MANYVTIANKLIAFANAKDDWDETEIPFSNAKNFINAAGNAAGVTNDSTNGDDAALTAAIAAVTSTTQQGTVWIPPGIYYLKTGITVANVDIICSPGAKFVPLTQDIDMVTFGKSATWSGGFFYTFDATVDFTGTCMLLDGDLIQGGIVNYQQISPRIQNVNFFSHADGTDGATAIKLVSSSGTKMVTFSLISGIRTRNFTYSIVLNSSSDGYVNGNVFSDMVLANGKYFIYINGEGTYSPGLNSFTNVICQVSATPASQAGIYSINGAGNIFNSFVFDAAGDYAINAVYFDVDSYANTLIGIGHESNVTDLGSNNTISGLNKKALQSNNVVTTSWTPGASGVIADGEQSVSSAIAVAGAVLGDLLIVSPPYDMQDCLFFGVVTSSNNIKIVISNESGDSRDFGSTAGVWSLKWIKRTNAYMTLNCNPGAIAANATWHNEYTIPGVVLGDAVLVSPGTDVATGLHITATVTDADKVTVVISNLSGSEITPTSSSWYYYIFPKMTAHYVAANVVDEASINDAAGTTRGSVAIHDASFGDFMIASISVDSLDLLQSCYLSAANTAEIRWQNETGGAVNLAECIYRIWRFKSNDRIGQ